MKKIIILIFLFLLLFIYSCSDAPKFEDDGLGNLIDAENDRFYLYCGSYLRAAEIMDESYARYDDGGKTATLHEIPGANPAQWLSENIKTMGLPLVFRESSIEEPTLENFGTERIHITQPGETTNVRIGLIDDEQQVQSIANDYLHGSNIKLPDDIELSLLFYFESPEYPGIYYVLNYFISGSGQEYLYDMWTKRCVLLSVPLV